MAIYIQCPICRRKQKMTHKKCVSCKEDLSKFKKSNRIRFWVSLSKNRKKFWKSVGFCLPDAKIAEANISKSRFGCSKISFASIARMYLDSTVKKKRYFHTVQIRIRLLGQIFGSKVVSQIKLSDLHNLQCERLELGWSPATIDQEISAAKTMLNWAVANDIISPDCLIVWRKTQKLLKTGANARNKIISLSEFFSILENLDIQSKAIASLGFFCGMRLGEILNLTWDKIFFHPEAFIKLESTDTKEGKSKIIPLPSNILNNPVSFLKAIPRSLDPKSRVFNLSRHKFRLAFILSCEQTGISHGRFKPNGLIFHDLRHCFITNMRRAGVDILSTMIITGHSIPRDFAIALRYNEFLPEDLLAAAAKMEQHLMKITVTQRRSL